MHSLRFLLLFSVAMTGSVQAAPVAPRTPVRTPGRAAALSNRLSDREVEAGIRARFAQSKIAADKFQFHVQGGVATLEGHTDVIQRKGTATRLARLAGAREVVNKIALSDAARQRAAANLAKGRRRVQVKRGAPRSQVRNR
jgi:hypothetical protein